MRLTSFSAAGYRSLRSIRLDIGQVSIFVGENGVGKSNLYRALQLIKASAEGTLAREIAGEGGMNSALWSGTRRIGQPARVIIDAQFVDDETAVCYAYKVEIGLPPPLSAGFAFEPHVKEESLTIEAGRRPVEMMSRKGQAIFARDGDGRRFEHPERVLNSETALALLGGAGRYPEVGDMRAAVAGWRFYHGFRTDTDSPVRRAALATTSPMLDEDGANLAAVFATLRHIREDTVDLDRCIADALGGAKLDVPVPGETATFGLVLPEFPQRVFRPQELSDGQTRFLALAGALLSYRLPKLIALNEPESSLHPRMMPALADMVARAAERTQVWVVTHSRELADLIRDRTGSRALTVVRNEGATTIEGMRATGQMPDDD
ncbi:AAA family ATPase [Aminobacter sp. MDW-2]|uniref:AAA family ATPase n=1 Tax=Aminobacter sp. MDW-2 TaxID=2666139 RepID=UPI0012AFCF99|nr:AAA family ATPase [Aminobacter sp. MDW-2]MRX35291.1 AAA family ATPase [Aminobacter sp. MDW-2]QNH35680.1 AAA family ATPase [Aminobacter sp. MDW-2]